MISVASYPEEQFEGLVTYIGATVDEKTRTVKVRAEVDNRHEKLKPGMFAKVLLLHQSDTMNNSPRVPVETVQTDGQKTLCLRATQGRVLFKARCGHWCRVDGYVKVISGLSRRMIKWLSREVSYSSLKS